MTHSMNAQGIVSAHVFVSPVFNNLVTRDDVLCRQHVRHFWHQRRSSSTIQFRKFVKTTRSNVSTNSMLENDSTPWTRWDLCPMIMKWINESVSTSFRLVQKDSKKKRCTLSFDIRFQEAFSVSKRRFAEWKLRLRSQLAVTLTGAESLEDVVQDYINRNVDYFELPTIVSVCIQ